MRCSPYLLDELCKLNLWFTFLPIWAFMTLPMTKTLCFGMLSLLYDYEEILPFLRGICSYHILPPPQVKFLIICIWWSYLPNPSARAGYNTRSIFKRSLTGLNSEFSFSYTSCLTKAEEISLPYYLPIAGGRIIGFIPFPGVLVLCEMQSVSSRIWTRVAVSISYDDNHYTTGTSIFIWWRISSSR